MSSLRSWEETWLYVPGASRDKSYVETQGGTRLISSTFSTDADQARLRLAAQAPAMARTLMILAGMGADPYCNGCGDTVGRGHRRDCGLMRLLYDAGIGELAQADRSPVLRVVK